MAAAADEERTGAAEARRDGVLLRLLPELEESLRALRPRLAELRARQGQADSAREAFALVSEALDEFERTLALVRETRTALTRVELRLTRRFDQLLRRLREVEQGL
jgi:phage terminase Nu1 subunit (DNA packaging protein)